MSLGAADEDLYNLADQYDGVAGPAPANASPVPMPEPEVQPVEPQGGLDSFDVDAAASNLSAVGQPAPASAPAPTEGAPAPVAPETPPVNPLSVAEPPRPALTGDPEKDMALNLQYQRDLSDHYGRREAEITKRATAEHAKQAAKELQIAQTAEKQRQAALAERVKQRANEQKYVNDAIAERAAAQKDLEGANWADKHTGRAVFATIFGALAQGFNNVAAIQSGHAPNAENEGAKAVDRMIQHDYDIKKQRIASMSESLLEARHGFKENEDNYRAAMNDLAADTAAKYTLVAKEAAARLAQQGASPEDIKRNDFVRNALTQSAKYEAEILDNEQKHRDAREGHEATRKLAEAHLGLQERQIDATIADRQANRYEKRREFDEREAARREAAAEKKDAKKEKSELALDARAVRDPDTGQPMGLASSPRVVDKIAQDIAATRSYLTKVNELADHIAKYGRIVDFEDRPMTKEGKERATLAAEVQAQGRQVSGIQASDAGQKLEHMMIGGSGLGFSGVADADVLRGLAARAAKKNEDRLRSTLSPMPGESAIRVPSTEKTEPAAPPKRAEMDNATEDRLMGVAFDDNAPPARRKQAVDLLRAAGRLP